jgi:hypothetical protein
MELELEQELELERAYHADVAKLWEQFEPAYVKEYFKDQKKKHSEDQKRIQWGNLEPVDTHCKRSKNMLGKPVGVGVTAMGGGGWFSCTSIIHMMISFTLFAAFAGGVVHTVTYVKLIHSDCFSWYNVLASAVWKPPFETKVCTKLKEAQKVIDAWFTLLVSNPLATVGLTIPSIAVPANIFFNQLRNCDALIDSVSTCICNPTKPQQCTEDILENIRTILTDQSGPAFILFKLLKQYYSSKLQLAAAEQAQRDANTALDKLNQANREVGNTQIAATKAAQRATEAALKAQMAAKKAAAAVIDYHTQSEEMDEVDKVKIKVAAAAAAAAVIDDKAPSAPELVSGGNAYQSASPGVHRMHSMQSMQSTHRKHWFSKAPRIVAHVGSKAQATAAGRRGK